MMLPFYQKYVNGEWIYVSEDEFINEVYKHHNKITPIIKEMLEGKEYISDNRYRLSMKKP